MGAIQRTRAQTIRQEGLKMDELPGGSYPVENHGVNL